MRRSFAVILAYTLGTSACDAFTDDPEMIFTFEESAHGQVVPASVDAASLSQGEIVFVGQLNTPRPCYRLVGDLDVADGRVTLTVDARQNQAQNCETIVGRFLYQGSIRRLDAGNYQVLVRHKFDDAAWPIQEFTFSVLVK
jgi:hypothetical protein